MPHAAAIQTGLAARFGVDVADLVEQPEAIVVAQDMRALAARHIGADDLVRDSEMARFRCQWSATSCR